MFSPDYRKFIVYFLMALIIPLTFLFSPKPQEKTCSTYIAINSYAGFMMNCDSLGFVDAAKNPSLLLQKDYLWQGRPLFIFSASIVGNLISPVVNLIPSSTLEGALEHLPPEGASKEKTETYIFYFAYLIINFLLVFLSIILLDKIADLLTDSSFPQWLKYVLAISVVSNIVTKCFFLSPHLQMLTMFSPLLCCYLSLKIALSEHLTYKKVLLITFAVGFLNLFYGTFILLLPTIVIALLYKQLRYSKLTLKFFLQIVLLTLVFVSSLLFWIELVTLKNGHYFSLEVNVYRQFVWIFDSLGISFGAFWEKFCLYTYWYYISMWIILIPAVALIFLSFFNYLTAQEFKSRINHYSLKRNILLGILIIYFLFLWLININIPRLTFNLFFILLCLVILELSVLDKKLNFLRTRKMMAVSTFVVIVWTIYNIFSYGPFE